MHCNVSLNEITHTHTLSESVSEELQTVMMGSNGGSSQEAELSLDYMACHVLGPLEREQKYYSGMDIELMQRSVKLKRDWREP